MTLDEVTAARVEQLLRAECGGYYTGFDHYVTQPCQWGHEWRFGGRLGFGGKFHMIGGLNPRMWVSCYSENETPERRALIANVNDQLKALMPSEAAA